MSRASHGGIVAVATGKKRVGKELRRRKKQRKAAEKERQTQEQRDRLGFRRAQDDVDE